MPNSISSKEAQLAEHVFQLLKDLYFYGIPSDNPNIAMKELRKAQDLYTEWTILISQKLGPFGDNLPPLFAQ